MSSKTKYYVVWIGHKPGIYDSWDQCKVQIQNFPNARYKGYPSRIAAENAYKTGYDEALQKGVVQKSLIHLDEKQPKPVYPSIAVDAAWSTKTGDMEYRGVDTKSGRVIFQQGPYCDGTNNIGEFLAIVHALALLKQKGSNLPIYTDSVTAISWVRRKKANTKLEPSRNNKILFDLITRAEKWLKENTWKNRIMKWETIIWGEIPADYGRK